MASGSEEHSGVGIALGVEKIGLLSLRGPLVTAIAAVLISAAAVLGLTRIKVDDSLSQLFRSDTPEFKQYEEVTKRFPSSEFDVLVVVEGKSLLDMIREDLVAERIAIDSYREIIQWLEGKDSTTQQMMKDILAVEEEHAEDMSSLLMGMKG